MARKTTIKAFEAWIAIPENEALVLETVASGVTLQKTSVALKQPYTCLHAYFMSSDERHAKMEAARRSWSDYVMDVNHQIAESVEPDRDHVAKAKLQIEVNTAAAKAYFRERWGERLQVDKNVVVGVDQALLGSVDELLRLAGEKVVAEVPAALPEEVDAR